MTDQADGTRRRGRALTAHERELWDGVARQVKPLRRRPSQVKPSKSAAAAPPPQPPAPMARKTRPHPPELAPKPPPRPAAPPLAALDRRDKRKLVRGKTAIDARIDLHGMTQAHAHEALAEFLHRAAASGFGYVLVITGKGKGDGARGVLRRQVPLWLALPDFRRLVIGFEQAQAAHGGEGALYVRIRRAR